MNSVLIFLAASMSLCMACPVRAGDLFYDGPVAKVTDGDTFTIKNDGQKVRVRFCGINSPEHGQAGYAEASRALGRLTEAKEVRCIQVGGGTPCDGLSRPISRDRIVAQCFVGDRDIAMEMIRQFQHRRRLVARRLGRHRRRTAPALRSATDCCSLKPAGLRRPA
jgi:endonuclease YncB( thermonuclease family)